MRNLFIFSVLISCWAMSCRPAAPACLKAKVLRVSCASFVVQVLNSDSVGDYGWKDIAGHGIYNNVFNVANPCKIGKWAKGEEFYFQISDTLQANECMTCMMYDAPPGKTYTIQDVKTICKD